MTDLSWVFEPSHQTLRPDFLQTLSKRMLALCLSSAVLSYALAETLMVQSTRASAVSSTGFLLIKNVLFLLFAFYVLLRFVFLVIQGVEKEPGPFGVVRSLAIAAVIPLHLALPLALICWPLGEGGVLLYSTVKLGLWALVAFRLAEGFQLLYGWPFWGGLVVAWSPVLLSLGVFVVGSALMVAMAAALFLGLLL